MTARTREDRPTTSTRAPGLERLDSLDGAAARAELLGCAGSERWARAMVDGRPYRAPAELLAAAETAFDALEEEDWRQAFAAHSAIGAPAADDIRGEAEQSAIGSATSAQRTALREGNARYRRRFGHVFLIRAAGRSTTEMLTALQARLRNDPAAELAVAAAEQRAITRMRLRALADASLNPTSHP